MGEDPSVNLLQDTFAKMVGMEKALFVPTGTMGNLSAVLSHCQRRGSEIIVGKIFFSHVKRYCLVFIRTH